MKGPCLKYTFIFLFSTCWNQDKYQNKFIHMRKLNLLIFKIFQLIPNNYKNKAKILFKMKLMIKSSEINQ